MRVAIGQLAITYHDKPANLAAIIALVRSAGEEGVELLVLPECPLVGWLSPRAADAAEPVPGPFTRSLSRLARQYGMAVVSGVEERAQHLVHNAAVLVGPDGEVLLHHRKIDELEIGLGTYAPGDRLGVADLGGTTVGVDICADSWGDDVVDGLARLGADVVLTPCAWAIDPGGEQANTDWITRRYTDLARRHDVVFVAANSVGHVDSGPWRGRVLHGDSLVVGPDGVVAQGPRHLPGLVLADVHLPGG